MLHAYLVTLAGVLFAQAAPGPNMLAVAGVALGQGRRAALLTVLGVASGVLLWSAAVAFGLAAVLALYPAFLTAMKVVGGSYLLYLGIKALRAAFTGAAGSVRVQAVRLDAGAAWRRGFLVVLTNPKAALMWIAVGTFLFGSGLTPLQVLGFGPLAFVTAALIYGAYAFLFSTGPALRGYARFARVIEGLFGSIFGLLGGRLLLDGIKELRS
ncbi:LysE family translocator [Afifella sp. IM 167]|uniref:LysE family translocator n=1 Tax=Afifella sp. IM 167 TaxID=2033586 RepID=UPI001CCFAB20|nr:LysE family translocator [Afifella sp. IM 167]MBZ8133940.1 threonine transporter [Afifella sp. IM 167]